MATGDHRLCGQSGQCSSQLHLNFPIKSGNTVSVAQFTTLSKTLSWFSNHITTNLRQIVLCRGSAIANVLSQTAMSGFLWLYTIIRGLHKATWGGEYGCITAPDVYVSCFSGFS